MGSRRTRIAAAVTLAVAGSSLGAGSSGETAGAVEGAGGCEVHQLELPEWATHGGVMDIERVRNLGVVYYGNAIAVNPDGSEYQRAVVWYGLDSPPVTVGALGAADDVAFELTPSGLINGQALDARTGQVRGWVQKLLTGRLTWAVPAPAGEEVPVDVYFRRINDRGAAAGTVFFEDRAAAVTWNKVHLDPVELPGGDHGYAEARDINNRRDVVGMVAVPVPGLADALMAQPTLWDRRGTPTGMATFGIDAFPVLLNDARQAAGMVGVGSPDDLANAHAEAGFWAQPDEVIGLGLLPGGGESLAYGLDEGGWVVGQMDVFAPDDPGAAPWGAVGYGFLWTADDPTRVRILPSVHADTHGVTDWRGWYGGAAHGVNSELNQVGTTSHGGYLEDGSRRDVPTVYVNADRCGQVVETTHTPFWLQDGSTADAATRTATPGARPGGYGVGAASERVLAARW